MPYDIILFNVMSRFVEFVQNKNPKRRFWTPVIYDLDEFSEEKNPKHHFYMKTLLFNPTLTNVILT